MVEEVLNQFNRDGETQPLTESDFHVRNPDYFPPQVKKRASTVTGVYLSGGLKIQFAGHLPCFGAQNAFSHRAFKA
jgi:hypothetical protein